ncbi:MAG: FlgD immunoglobulin-like domain containing protein [Ignavibacteria bacterium]|nr:FlgD immunoglobulin-like domain containing protein [Ignavibacteria bacterium]
MLAQNFPNPFNSSTVIMFSIPEAFSGGPVNLAIFDVQGRLVKRLLHTQMPGGKYATRWDGTDASGAVAASGVYFYHLVVGNQRSIGKMSFVK